MESEAWFWFVLGIFLLILAVITGEKSRERGWYWGLASTILGTIGFFVCGATLQAITGLVSKTVLGQTARLIVILMVSVTFGMFLTLLTENQKDWRRKR